MYSISEDKDISIKSIERIIKESAMDCALNYLRNRVYDQDDMRICDYQRCDYKCDVQQPTTLTPEELDYNSYNLYYADQEFMEIINNLKKLFNQQNLYQISQLESRFNNKFLLISALDYIIQERIPILNTHSQLCFLKFYGDIFYLDISVDTDSSPTQADYLENPIFVKINTPDQIAYKFELVKLPQIITILQDKNTTPQQYEQIFNNLTPLTVELFIEGAILSKKKPQTQQHQHNLVNWINNRYSIYIKQINGYQYDTISTYLYYTSDIPQLKKIRCLNYGVGNSGRWDYCEIPIKDIEQTQEEKIENLGEFGYYGVYENKNNKFLIVDVSDQTKITGVEGKGKDKDTRTKSRGRVCKTITKNNLLKICMKLKIDHIGEDGQDLIVQKTRNIDKKDLKKIIPQLEDKVIDKKDIQKLTNKDLKRAYYFLNYIKTDQLCNIIKQWLETNNKLEVK